MEGPNNKIKTLTRQAYGYHRSRTGYARFRGARYNSRSKSDIVGNRTSTHVGSAFADMAAGGFLRIGAPARVLAVGAVANYRGAFHGCVSVPWKGK